MTPDGRLRRFLEAQPDVCHPDGIERHIETLESLQSGRPRDRRDRDVAIFSALASETRYDIVRLLVAADRELCVCELDASLDVTESAVSHAMKRLRDAGLVTRRKDGRWRYYEATPVATTLVSVLDDEEAP